jgi:formate dehydrogenase subunit gamma
LSRENWDPESAGEIIAVFAAQPGGLLPAVRALQNHFGAISDPDIGALAGAFNLSQAEVHGVVSFYHDFRQQPAGRHIVRICQAEACQAMGSRSLTDQIKTALGIDFHQTTSDGLFSLEPVYCLGNCACAPAIMVDGDTYGRVDVDRAESIFSHRRQAGQA